MWHEYADVFKGGLKLNGEMICDFGFWACKDRQQVTRFEGKFGYFAPEYLTHEMINEKTDVYGFGILLLEILTEGLRHRDGDYRYSLTPTRSEYSSSSRTPPPFPIGSHDHDDDTPAAVTCLSLKWKNIFKPWKKSSSPATTTIPPPSPSPLSDDQPNQDHRGFNSRLITFRSFEIRRATNNFSEENLIGRGGYADVFKGRLNGEMVAIKRLNNKCTNNNSRNTSSSNFLKELNIISHIDHPNCAKLIGCSSDKESCLVFQLSPLGSLASVLHGPNREILSWNRRYNIALGIARGLLYLHDHCDRPIIHRDIKSDNILLTKDFEPQICDFGLAKWLEPDADRQQATRFEGTFGYFAPEYLTHGIIDEKTDVYAFGILLLEILTGRKALDYLQQSILIWAKPLMEDDDNVKELVDPSLGDDYEIEEVERVILTASLCVEQSPFLRPRMVQTLQLLKSEEEDDDDDIVMEFDYDGTPRPLT
ncbi:hypothetical protein PIB30_043714 [Stylosanthes scabra]|uniref:Protein kinase domain-containing protein n=1 Tax=Stylosanthes scabra TaxID=79078 RepID=A0ABU6UEA4_9FABA|nr:hypothetical protein [Stylosanthes scabra]